MRRRYVLVVTAMLLAAGVSGARAQMDKLQDTTPEERAQMQTAFMKAKLALTPDQLSKVTALNLKYAKLMDPIIKGSAGHFVKMREMRQLNTEKEAELKALLSPE